MRTPDHPGRRTVCPFLARLTLTALVLMCAGAAPTAAEIADFVGREIINVVLRSDEGVIRDDAVRELVETEVGQPLSMRQVRESVTHLFSLGLYEGVEVDGRLESGGVVLEYALIPLQLIERVEIGGDVGVSARAARRAIADAHGEAFRAEDVPLVVGTLNRFYAARGFLSAEVETAVVGDGARRVLRVASRAGPRARIERLSVRGVSSTMYPIILARLGLEAGQPYNGVEVDRRLREYEAELREQRYYEAATRHDIEVMDGGTAVHLILEITRGRRISVAIDGPSLPDADLAALVRVERERSVDQDLLEDADRRITSFLRDRGYRDARVEHTREVAGDELSIVFNVNPGRLYEVDRVQFTGNTAVAASTLAPLVTLAAGGPLIVRELDTSLDQVAEYYRQLGYATVRVEPVINERSSTTTTEADVRVVVRLEIEEGVRTNIRSLTIDGNDFRSDADLTSLITSTVGGPYYARRVAADRDRIRTVYLNAGFERAVATVERQFADDLSAVDLTYRIVEGEQMYVEHLLIVGNERISSDTIRRELALEEGQPLGLSAVAETRRQLNALGLFRRIDIREFSHGGGNERDVVVIVEEAPATRLGYGGGLEVAQLLRRRTNETTGVSQAVERIEFAPRGFVQIGRRNLWGKNRSIDLFTRVSVRRKNDPVDPATADERSGFGFNEYRVLGTYTEPRAFGRVWDVFVTGFVEQAVRPGFDLFSRGVNAEAVRQLTPALSTSVSYAWGQNNTSNLQLDPEDVPLVDRLFEKVRLSSFSGGIVRNTRDDIVDPGAGEMFSVDAKLAARAIGSEVGFVKTFSQMFVYRTLPGPRRIVVAAGARVGLAVGFQQPGAVSPLPPAGMDGPTPSIPVQFDDPLLPISERFFAGGDTTVRGYAFDRLGIPVGAPEGGGTISADGFPGGGNAVVIFNTELRFPVTRDLGLVGFLDAGNVYDRVSSLDLTRIRGGVGFGVRYRSPVGPIRVDLGFKLDREAFATGPNGAPELEPLTALHISIGQAF